VPQSCHELDLLVKEHLSESQIQQIQIVIITVILTLCFKKLMSFLYASLKYLSNPVENLKLTMFNLVMWLPCGRKYMDKEVNKAREDFYHRIKNRRKNAVYMLPEKPMREDTIMERIKKGSEEAKKYYRDGGKMSGGVYTSKDEHWDFISDVMR